MTDKLSIPPAGVSPSEIISHTAPFSEADLRLLFTGAAELGIPLDAATATRFIRFATLLEEGNQRLNLTRIRPEDVVTLHFLDSLALASLHFPASGARVLDVGTGAGFPGVPLALAFPGVEVTLMDSTNKRLAFIDYVLADLKVTNAHTLHARAEELARDPRHRERYDLVVARAVAPLSTLAGWLLPFARPGGLVVAYKSQNAQDEIEIAQAVIAELGGALEQVADVPLPHSEIVRKLVALRKKRSVPLKKKSDKSQFRQKTG